MEANFWHQKWERGEIGFHESQPNPFLTEHFEKLSLAQGSCVFLPLCGKTRDIAWLLARGYRVAGAELSELAIRELFKELGLVPEISKHGKLIHYRAEDIDIFVGDIFELSASALGPVDAIYDRAALVALPAIMRAEYSAHLMQITHQAPQLLVTYQYNPLLMEGPPFSVCVDEVQQYYGASYQLTAVETREVEGGLKKQVASMETVWILQPFKR